MPASDRVFVMLGALVTFGSGPTPNTHPPQPAMRSTTESDTLPVVPLSTSESIVGFLRNVHGVHRRVRRVIRDDAAWRTFWDSAAVRSVGAAGPAHPAAPTVDFSREMLIVASDGLRRNYDEISISGVDGTGDSLMVHVRTRVNLLKGCRLESLWAPMAVARVPLDSRPVKFIDTVVDEQCKQQDPEGPSS